jgi:hypothetical protein
MPLLHAENCSAVEPFVSLPTPPADGCQPCSVLYQAHKMGVLVMLRNTVCLLDRCSRALDPSLMLTELSVPIVACLCRRSDYEVGEELLRKYVFIHLSEPADKLQLMLAMLHKLYALVSCICVTSISGTQLHGVVFWQVGYCWACSSLGVVVDIGGYCKVMD